MFAEAFYLAGVLFFASATYLMITNEIKERREKREREAQHGKRR